MRLAALPLTLALVSCATPRTTVAPVERLHFIENDFPRALSQARVAKVPLFVDAWAPW